MRARRFKDPWSRPIADLVGPIIDPALARRGFGKSDVILFWEEIVGARISSMSQPINLQWPPRGRAAGVPATLVVRVETGFALELQHLSGVVIERVNAHLGWRCVDRLVLKQGPLEPRPGLRAKTPAPNPEIVKAAEEAAKDIADEPLRDALTRLGAYVLTRSVREARDQ